MEPFDQTIVLPNIPLPAEEHFDQNNLLKGSLRWRVEVNLRILREAPEV